MLNALFIFRLSRRWLRLPDVPLGTRKHYGASNLKLQIMRAHVDDPIWFSQNIGYRRSTFHAFIVWPIYLAITRQRHESKRKPRKPTIDVRLRCVRWLMFLKGSKPRDLATMFGQSMSATHKDLAYLSHLVSLYLYPHWVRMIERDSVEYTQLKGRHCFISTEQAIYAADIMKIRIRRPLDMYVQSRFFSAKPGAHALGCCVFVDSMGVARHVMGPVPGAFSDNTYVNYSQFALNHAQYVHMQQFVHTHNAGLLCLIHRHVRQPDRVLIDGCIGPFASDIFSGPMYKHQDAHYNVPRWIRVLDKFHCRSRVLIENYFSLYKNLFPVFQFWTGKRTFVNAHIRAGFVLTNIKIVMDGGLRAANKCEESCCFYCHHIAGGPLDPTIEQLETALSYW